MECADQVRRARIKAVVYRVSMTEFISAIEGMYFYNTQPYYMGVSKLIRAKSSGVVVGIRGYASSLAYSPVR